MVVYPNHGGLDLNVGSCWQLLSPGEFWGHGRAKGTKRGAKGRTCKWMTGEKYSELISSFTYCIYFFLIHLVHLFCSKICSYHLQISLNPASWRPKLSFHTAGSAKMCLTSRDARAAPANSALESKLTLHQLSGNIPWDPGYTPGKTQGSLRWIAHNPCL